MPSSENRCEPKRGRSTMVAVAPEPVTIWLGCLTSSSGISTLESTTSPLRDHRAVNLATEALPRYEMWLEWALRHASICFRAARCALAAASARIHRPGSRDGVIHDFRVVACEGVR